MSALRAVPILGVFVAILGALAGLGALAQSLGALRRLHAPAEPVLDGDEVRVR